MRVPARRRALLAGLIGASFWASTAVASADSIQIAITSANPEQGVPVNLSFSGTSSSIDNSGDGPFLDAVIRPTGGIGCQSSFENDQQAAGGASMVVYSTDNFGSSGAPQEGPGSWQSATTFNPGSVGSYLICAWLEDYSHTVKAGPTNFTFTTRGPQIGQLAVGIASPAQPYLGFHVNYTTQTDQQLSLLSIIKPTGGLPCAASYELDQEQKQPEQGIFTSDYPATYVFGGPTTTTGSVEEDTPGAYLICTWIEGPSGGEVDASAATPVYVGTPPPPPPPPQLPPPPQPVSSSAACRRSWQRVIGRDITLLHRAQSLERRHRSRSHARSVRRDQSAIKSARRALSSC